MPDPSNARQKADAKFDKTQKGMVDCFRKALRDRTACLKALLRLAKEERKRAAAGRGARPRGARPPRPDSFATFAARSGPRAVPDGRAAIAEFGSSMDPLLIVTVWVTERSPRLLHSAR